MCDEDYEPIDKSTGQPPYSPTPMSPEQEAVNESIAAALRRRQRFTCGKCWTSSFELVDTEVECDLAHPHDGEHMRCLCCAQEWRIAELTRERRIALDAWKHEIELKNDVSSEFIQMKVERDEARAECERLCKAILEHNKKSDATPQYQPGESPKSVTEGLNFIAKWFDFVYGDAGTGFDVVQADLRQWARDFDEAQQRIAELESQLKTTVSVNCPYCGHQIENIHVVTYRPDDAARIAKLEAQNESILRDCKIQNDEIVRLQGDNVVPKSAADEILLLRRERDEARAQLAKFRTRVGSYTGWYVVEECEDGSMLLDSIDGSNRRRVWACPASETNPATQSDTGGES